MTPSPEAPLPPGSCRQVRGSSAGLTADYNRQRVVLPAVYSRRPPDHLCCETQMSRRRSNRRRMFPMSVTFSLLRNLDASRQRPLMSRDGADSKRGLGGGDKFARDLFGVTPPTALWAVPPPGAGEGWEFASSTQLTITGRVRFDFAARMPRTPIPPRTEGDHAKRGGWGERAQSRCLSPEISAFAGMTSAGLARTINKLRSSSRKRGPSTRPSHSEFDAYEWTPASAGVSGGWCGWPRMPHRHQQRNRHLSKKKKARRVTRLVNFRRPNPEASNTTYGKSRRSRILPVQTQGAPVTAVAATPP